MALKTSQKIILAAIAGGLFAFSGAIPDAHAVAVQSNPHLFVSGEGHNAKNKIGPGNVIEVIVGDPLIRDTRNIVGEPSITVNGNDLRMVQATSGYWYGYFADRKSVLEADNALLSVDQDKAFGLNYGSFCNTNVHTIRNILGPELTIDAPALAVARNLTGSTPETSNFEAELGSCTSTVDPSSVLVDVMNVLRNSELPNKSPHKDVLVTGGQIGLTDFAIDNVWPFIQLYDFEQGESIQIIYYRAGGSETVTLLLDDPQESISLDREVYSVGSDVLVTVEDQALNVDPTSEDVWVWETNGTKGLYYQLYDDAGTPEAVNTSIVSPRDLSGIATPGFDVAHFDEHLVLMPDAQNSGSQKLLAIEDTNYVKLGTVMKKVHLDRPVALVETRSNSAVFENWDYADNVNLRILDDARAGDSFEVKYADSGFLSGMVESFTGTIDFDESSVGGAWNAGEYIEVILRDNDANLNSIVGEELAVSDPDINSIPTIRMGSPVTLANSTIEQLENLILNDYTVDEPSDRARISVNIQDNIIRMIFDLGRESDVLSRISGDNLAPFNYLNYDFNSFLSLGFEEITEFAIGDGDAWYLVPVDDLRGMVPLDVAELTEAVSGNSRDRFFYAVTLEGGTVDSGRDVDVTAVIDIFNFGQIGDGILSGRVNNAIYRLEVTETGDDTGVFSGAVGYVMFNQINQNLSETYDKVRPIEDELTIIAHGGLAGDDYVQVDYLDFQDGAFLKIGDRQKTVTHSGSVSFDKDTYQIGDTVTVTLNDFDLNADVNAVDVYTLVNIPGDAAYSTVGELGFGANSRGQPFGSLLDVTFNDVVQRADTPFGSLAGIAFDKSTRWSDDPNGDGLIDCRTLGVQDSLVGTGFGLRETGENSGVFTGEYKIPYTYCANPGNEYASLIGVHMKAKYTDHRDDSGRLTRTSDSAKITSNTGSVSLERKIYPVPWGNAGDYEDPGAPDLSIFRVHDSAIKNDTITDSHTLQGGDLGIYITIDDSDYDTSDILTDTISQNVVIDGRDTGYGPVKIGIKRGSDVVVLAYAGGAAQNLTGVIHVGNDGRTAGVRELGPIYEIAPDAGIFEFGLKLRYTDGPAHTDCPRTDFFESLVGGTGEMSRFSEISGEDRNYCIRQGDVLFVEYADFTDVYGKTMTSSDSAVFGLSDGMLHADRGKYIIGSDAFLTIVDSDLNLDSKAIETWDLDLVQWDSDSATTTLGDLGIDGAITAFGPDPLGFVETGHDSGIFQIKMKIPEELGGDYIDEGEEIALEYADWGPSTADYIGEKKTDVSHSVSASNFGVLIELDQEAYTWTDRVHIKITAPSYNSDPLVIDEIGAGGGSVRISTGDAAIDNYKLVETGSNTGIFSGEVTLTGFENHDANDDGDTGDASGKTSLDNTGPDDGMIATSSSDYIIVSFESVFGETASASAPIRWHIGTIEWLEKSYEHSEFGMVRVTDPDMNLDSNVIDSVEVDVYSDADIVGNDPMLYETGVATGIFEGQVSFTVKDECCHRLRVAEGDTVFAEYEDRTLPEPYAVTDDLEITATALIETT